MTNRYPTYKVGNWPGSLAIPCYGARASKGWGFGGAYPVLSVWFVFEGYVWYGRNAGDSQLTHCKKTKREWLLGKGA